jgi:hypothetical protein
VNAIETTVRKVRKVVILVLVWLSFVVAALAAIPLSLLYLTEREYGRNVLLSMDRVMAAVLGWSGQYTVSAQCGKSACWLCQAVCWLLNRMDRNHCDDAARDEGA